MDHMRDNEEEYRRGNKKEFERSYAPTNSGQPNQMANVNEEMGADFAYGLPTTHVERIAGKYSDEELLETQSSGTALGWVSLIFAIASLFIWPALLGITAAVLGYIAYRQGARGIGGWAITIGLVAAALNLVLVPLYFAFT
ncbi:hypothetical protein ACFQZE_01985 [Paenibacillus sp. GCM10027627]|uniref:hypothetical protein n=1 Tax=unclassified Paenibacillus TaxID=185978 RepID=UPI00362A6E97